MEKEYKKSVTKGIISITSTGTGYVTAVGFSNDVLIEQQFLNTALHGDEVEISVFPQIDKERLSGEVTRILNRAKMEFVGTVDKRKGSSVAFIIPDDKKMYVDIFISPAESGQIKNGLKILARIKKWNDPKKNPEGIILKVIGKKGDNDAEMESIVLEKGFQTEFPPGVEKEAEILEKRSKPIPARDIAGRKDFRSVTTFTIDPEDAKNFDDE